MREEFIEAIVNNQNAFGLNIAEEKIEALAEYYALVQKHNLVINLLKSFQISSTQPFENGQSCALSCA